MAVRFCAAVRNERRIWVGRNGSRSSGCSVSGRRTVIHTETATPSVASRPKVQGHEATVSTAWPRLGAMIGAAMNTSEVRLITRAISRPA